MAPRFEVQMREDAGPSVFLSQELEFLMAKQFRVDLPPLKIFGLIPVNTRTDPRAATVAYSLLTQIGAAAIMRTPSSEIPYVDIYRQKFTQPIKEMLTKYGWTITELENAEFANVPLDAEGAEAARRAMAELASRIALTGDTPTQLPGLLVNPNIPRSTVASGVSGVTWALKTADEIIRDVSNLAGSVVSTSKGAYEPDTLLLPISQYNRIADLPRSSYSDKTVLNYILENNPYIQRIEWLRELAGAGTGGVDMMICYATNEDYFEYMMPLPFEQRPQVERDMRLDVICREKSGGTIVRKPLALAIGEGI